MTVTDRLQTGDATISADATFGDGPFTVHGVAQAAEVTRGVSGERRYWPPEVLRDAADLLEGVPITDPDDHADLDAGQPHPDLIVGEVTRAKFDDERGALLYEGEVDDPDRARQIARGRVDVSPSVALEPGEHDPERDAERVAAVVDYRDLAIVADGAHASASIQPGTAEALARHFEGLQSPSEANAVNVDVSPPPRVVNAAEAAQQAQEDGLIPESCGTGVGDDRMSEIIADDLWERCGNAQQAKWGWYVEWAQRTANDVMAALDEPPIYEGLQRTRVRTPDYQGTQDEDWSAPTLDAYLRGYDTLPAPGDVDGVEDLSQEGRSLIARKSLLGTPSAETLRELRFFPVVDPATDELNRRALGAVRSGRGDQADIPADARASAQRRAGELLIAEFDSDIELDTMADVSDVQQGTLVRWSSGGDRPAYGRVEEVRTEGDAPLSDEIDGDPEPIQPPAALIEVHRPDGDGGWQPSGTMVGHTLNTDTLTVIDELPDPEPLAQYWGGDDDPHDDTGPSIPADNLSDPLMDDITDADRELLAAARQHDDPTVVETAAAERLSDHEELIEAAEGTDDPTVVSEPDYEALEERVAEVRAVLADALQEQTGLSDTTIESLSFEALAVEFETDDGTLDVESLVQSPETGSGPSDPDLSEAERERKAKIEERLSALDGEDNALARRETERLEGELETIVEGEA